MAFGRSDHRKAIQGVRAQREEEQVRALAVSRKLSLFEAWLSEQIRPELGGRLTVPGGLSVPGVRERKGGEPQVVLIAVGQTNYQVEGSQHVIVVPESLTKRAIPTTSMVVPSPGKPVVPTLTGMPQVKKTMGPSSSLADGLERRNVRSAGKSMFGYRK